jgi:acetyl esterase
MKESSMRAMHPDPAGLMALIRAAGRPPFETLSPVEARSAYAASRNVVQLEPQEVAECRDLTIDGPGGALPLRLYRGAGTTAGTPLPCLVFYHGGGWVIGDLESHDALCRALANAAGCAVVAVDYRLAPEHRFPAAALDAQAAMTFVAREAAGLAIDPSRIAVGGDSAGGNLAAVVALMGRDGMCPAPMFQVLFYPAVDLAMTSDGYALITEGVPLTSGTMRWFVEHYTPDAKDRLDWRASPLRAASLAGVAPALVVTAGHDPLCDEGQAYARRLEQEGVRVTALHLADQVHGLLTMNRVIAAGGPVIALAAAMLRDGWR